MEAVSTIDALTVAVQQLGSQSALARLCEVSQPTVWKWLHKAKRVPAEYVLAIEAATNVSRHELRPDIYPREEPPAQPSAGDPPPPAGGSAALPRNSVGEVLA
tara:strand:- start:1415 stop:1723 length:309 start_codon:yes stop_codon:yes gene_type:complete